MPKSRSSRSTRKQQTDPDIETGSIALTPPRRTAPQDEVSPTGTFDTALTSPNTFDEPYVMNSPPPQKVTIEHNVKSGGSRTRSAGMLLGMTKPALAIAGFLILGSAGAAAFGWFKIPGLSSQIQELEAQVALLSGEIDRLSAENDRFENLNDELNQTVADFRDLNQDLNATVIELEDIAGDLNITNLALEVRIGDLAYENDIYARLNQDLNSTASQLAQEVDFFEAALAKLILESGTLSNLTEALEGVTTQIGNLTTSQTETLTEMYTVLSALTSENDRLASLNGDLVSIVSFLDETSIGLDNSLQQITGFLADQIVANQVLVTESLENTYRQRVQNWDCGYRDHFREEVYGADYSLPISDITDVIEYANERVLSELCLDATDFQQYLLQEYPDGLNSNRLIRGMNEYTIKALDFYFPEVDEIGVTPEEWAEAAYECQALRTSFSWNRSN